MVVRQDFRTRVARALERNPIVAVVGPRQCGKTTLARTFLPASAPQYFDAEDPRVAYLLENPMQALEGLRGLVVIDEAQRAPQVFPSLRVLADREGLPARFLILGSASPALARQASESLAGRVEVVELQGFGLSEVGNEAADRLWLRGGFPRSFLAATDEDAHEWRRQFVSLFLERDLAQLGFGMSPQLLGRFWSMLAHSHGQIWNGSEIAASLGIAPNTARAYLDALEQTYMVRRLQPWHENLGKRVVKSPKVYLRDSGLLHALLGIVTRMDLLTHPKLGASWEGFVLEEIIRRERPDAAHFHAVHGGGELDLLLLQRGRRLGYEVKRADSPTLTRSMRTAFADLALDALVIIHPGDRTYSLGPGIVARPLVAASPEPGSG